ncbi:hypothetical protein M0812_20534 [Anaeramoeba flamelloides]|uniref:Uncharacterized protein n=1 Tax=Anaeramoeba flamelloides TaxID=1746091 RepID=A0AAV7YUL4_9EUKA|nr:hypothetical protein M0812_20534 [Anaeramoeba flamelloides]
MFLNKKLKEFATERREQAQSLERIAEIGNNLNIEKEEISFQKTEIEIQKKFLVEKRKEKEEKKREIIQFLNEKVQKIRSKRKRKIKRKKEYGEKLPELNEKLNQTKRNEKKKINEKFKEKKRQLIKKRNLIKEPHDKILNELHDLHKLGVEFDLFAKQNEQKFTIIKKKRLQIQIKQEYYDQSIEEKNEIKNKLLSLLMDSDNNTAIKKKNQIKRKIERNENNQKEINHIFIKKGKSKQTIHQINSNLNKEQQRKNKQFQIRLELIETLKQKQEQKKKKNLNAIRHKEIEFRKLQFIKKIKTFKEKLIKEKKFQIKLQKMKLKKAKRGLQECLQIKTENYKIAIEISKFKKQNEMNEQQILKNKQLIQKLKSEEYPMKLIQKNTIKELLGLELKAIMSQINNQFQKNLKKIKNLKMKKENKLKLIQNHKKEIL